MLTVLFAIGVGGTLATMAVASLLSAHVQVADFTNRYAVLNDLLEWIRCDVRQASSMELIDNGPDETAQTLTLRSSTGTTVYNVYADRVSRSQDVAGPTCQKSWGRLVGLVKLVLDHPGPGGSPVLHVTVMWRNEEKSTGQWPVPHRRFDLAIYCAGEMPHE